MARILDLDSSDVRELFEGKAAAIRELVYGEHTHVGGEEATRTLAQKAGITSEMVVLDVGSGLGGPARFLAREYGCKVVGLDSTPVMIDEAISRTKAAGLDDKALFRLGTGLDMPFHKHTFDVVWGQDAWCYMTDKSKLISECARVLKPNGIIAFTDWLETDLIVDDERQDLHGFMVFPYLETMEGYKALLDQEHFSLIEYEDLWEEFHQFLLKYHSMIIDDLQESIRDKFGDSVFERLIAGTELWVKAAVDGKVSLARFIGRLNK